MLMAPDMREETPLFTALTACPIAVVAPSGILRSAVTTFPEAVSTVEASTNIELCIPAFIVINETVIRVLCARMVPDKADNCAPTVVFNPLTLALIAILAVDITTERFCIGTAAPEPTFCSEVFNCATSVATLPAAFAKDV